MNSLPGQQVRRLFERAAEYGEDAEQWAKQAIDGYLRDRPALLDAPPLPGGPLFVYGSLKPGELAFPQVEPFVEAAVDVELAGHRLRSRDGLPLLVESGDGVLGALLVFDDVTSGYATVRRFEPSRHYRWAPRGVELTVFGSPLRANALLGIRPDTGAEQEHLSAWSCADDPVFVRGLPIAASLALPWLQPSASLDGLFHLQSAYLLLWSVVERLTALRFGPVAPPMQRLRLLSLDQQWATWFRAAEVPMGERRVVDSRDPADKVRLKPDGSNAWSYWYQVRSNLSHRGKGAHRDVRIVADAFIDVHDVLRAMLLSLLPRIAERWDEVEPGNRDHSWRIRQLVSEDG